MAQPVLPLHALVTNGAVHRKIPVPWLKSTLKGFTHAAHAGFVAVRTWNAATHAALSGAFAHAAASESRSSASSQTFWSDGVMGVVVPAGQFGYALGQTFAWFEQTRGRAAVLHVAGFAHAAHAAPPDPQFAFVKPRSHCLFARQQPPQFAALHERQTWPRQF